MLSHKRDYLFLVWYTAKIHSLAPNLVTTQAAQAHASRKRGIYKLFMVLESGRDLRERPVLGYKRPLTI